ncbi:MAG: hypothetical protein ACRD4W_03440, partial [Nitrososphaeraceae archaeon]
MEHNDIPPAISTYLQEVLKAPALLVGCRATRLGISKPCCEFDIIVLSNENHPHKVTKLGSHWIELVHIPLKSKVRKVILDNIEEIVLNDTDDLVLSSIKNTDTNMKRRTTSKSAIARKLLISCLMRHTEIEGMSQKSPI